MLDSYDIHRLYDTVLHNDVAANRISERDIRKGIRSMAIAYSPANSKPNNTELPDFNHPACRCAYLHKYAPLHTYIVIDVMKRILRRKRHLFSEMIRTDKFKISCLGGGPGIDIIGVLAAMYTEFNSFRSSVTVIDSMENWEVTFKSIMRELEFGEYGAIWKDLAVYFDWKYIRANLLQSMASEVNRSIGSASFVTMVKFVSAVSSSDPEKMLEKIFHAMKPGAILLFIDNAAGGFSQAVDRASKKNFFQEVLPPRRHVPYEFPDFKTDRFGCTSCFKTRVTILLLQKPFNQHAALIPLSPPSVSSNINRLFIERDNLNNLRNIQSSSLKLPVNQDNLSQNFNKVHSFKSPVKKQDLNLSKQQKKTVLAVSPQLPPSYPYRPPRRNKNVNNVSRKTDADDEAISRSIVQNHRPISSSVATTRPAVQLSATSTSSSRDAQRSGRRINQQSSNDADDTTCLCCVIS